MASTPAARLSEKIIAGTATPADFTDIGCELLRDVVIATPTEAMAANPAVRTAIVARAQTCRGDDDYGFGPGFWDRVALSGPADALAGVLESDLAGRIGRIALTLVFVAGGFGMVLLGLRSLSSPLTASKE